MQGMITITVSDCPDPELAESIARAQRHMPGWSERVVGFIFDCKTRSDCFNIIASANGTVIGRVQCLRSMTDKGGGFTVICSSRLNTAAVILPRK